MTYDRTLANHNHITRDIKRWGSCPGCDDYWIKERFRYGRVHNWTGYALPLSVPSPRNWYVL